MNNDTQTDREALVIKSTGSWYTLCDSLSGERVEARLSGRIRLQGRRSTNPIVVGDRVDYHVESGGNTPSPETEKPQGKAARKKAKGRPARATAQETAQIFGPGPTPPPTGQPEHRPVPETAGQIPATAGMGLSPASELAQPSPACPQPARAGQTPEAEGMELSRVCKCTGQTPQSQPAEQVCSASQFAGQTSASPDPETLRQARDPERTNRPAPTDALEGPVGSDGLSAPAAASVPAVEAPTPAVVGVITRIHDRRNYIIRRSPNLSRESHIIAANIDQAFLVATLAFPETSFEFIDRFLVTAAAYHIPAVIVLNKTDLYDTPELTEKRAVFLETYALAGYEVMELAAGRDQGVDALRERLRGRVSLLSGNSGVGKSTLIRAVDPSLTARVGAISDSHHRGRHTTTFSEMYPLEGGGWLIDTPGIKGFGLIDLSGEEVGRYFPDLFGYAPRCGYYNCTHTHEPGCAVKEAVENGEVSLSRYISYLKLLEEDEKYRK